MRFDETASRVSYELRKGPRGGGWEKDFIIRHVNGAEMHTFAPKVGIKVPVETRDDPDAPVATARPSPMRSETTMLADVSTLMAASVSHPTVRVAHARPRLGT